MLQSEVPSRGELCVRESCPAFICRFVQMAQASVRTCLVFSTELLLADFKSIEIQQENASAYIGPDGGLEWCCRLDQHRKDP